MPIYKNVIRSNAQLIGWSYQSFTKIAPFQLTSPKPTANYISEGLKLLYLYLKALYTIVRNRRCPLLTQQMPGFSLAVDARCSVGFISNQRRTDAVRYLTNQQHHTCIGALEAEHGVEIDQQICEPHGGAQVVQKMSRCVTYPPAD